jgi:hypothetical protein
MDQFPALEADRLSAGQISSLFWGRNFHYFIHKCPSLSQINPLYASHPASLQSVLILSYQLCLGLKRGLCASGLPTTTLYPTFLSPVHATCPTHLILLGFITRIIFGEMYMSLTLSQLMSYIYMELLVKPESLTSYIYGPTFGNAESLLFLFVAQCFNIESMQKVILWHSCV